MDRSQRARGPEHSTHERTRSDGARYCRRRGRNLRRLDRKGVHVVEEPHDDVFGRTSVVADPDGTLIRVSPVD
ncbi:VOC family protein [Rathayibacter tritici]|uniref:VOC family protein n=1 Tax=Rathayibacter tritici TaxID=33888 RepID=UPI000B1AEF03